MQSLSFAGISWARSLTRRHTAQGPRGAPRMRLRRPAGARTAKGYITDICYLSSRSAFLFFPPGPRVRARGPPNKHPAPANRRAATASFAASSLMTFNVMSHVFDPFRARIFSGDGTNTTTRYAARGTDFGGLRCSDFSVFAGRARLCVYQFGYYFSLRFAARARFARDPRRLFGRDSIVCVCGAEERSRAEYAPPAPRARVPLDVPRHPSASPRARARRGSDP